MMVKDLELMKDISPLFEKKIVIWGADEQAGDLLYELKDMRAGERGITFCDSDCGQWGKQIEGYEIVSPEQARRIIISNNEKEVVVCIAFADVRLQNEVLNILEGMDLAGVTVYTRYALKWGMYFNLKNRYIGDRYRKKMLAEHEKNRITHEEGSMVEQMKYFAYAPLHNDEMILIYQPGKVGSRSLYRSIKSYGKYVLHSHVLTGAEYGDDNLQRLLEKKPAKIISLVREPIARQISVMWENIHNINRYSADVDFEEVENFYFKQEFENEEFEWFFEYFNSVFGINVYEFPFDRDKGYGLIKKNNIEVLLMKVEKLNELEEVVGSFLHIPEFKLHNFNMAKDKRYRFAYQDYLREFTISKDTLKHVYYENKYIRFFYTDQEIESFYTKWIEHSRQ